MRCRDDTAHVPQLIGEARGRAEIARALRHAITSGALVDGELLPSSRSLAAALSVARGTIVGAIDELAGEGFVDVQPGSGVRVAPRVSAREPAEITTSVHTQPAGAPTPRIDLSPGRPATRGISEDRAWRAAWRAALSLPLSCDVPAAAGEPRLRQEVASHVRTARALVCDASHIVITAGTAEAFQLIMLALQHRSGRKLSVAVEDPGYRGARRAAEVLGQSVVAVPVREGSVDVREISDNPHTIDALFVTPSHQYPLGGSLPVAERYELREWAAAHDVVIVEDDYDSEFRHGAAPLPAIAALGGPAAVLLVGTFSKTLSPTIRLGYVVVTDQALYDAMMHVREQVPIPVPAVLQDALATYMSGGGFRRHVARVRRAYAHRRSALIQCSAHLDESISVSALDGGLHGVIAWAKGNPRGERLRSDLDAAGIRYGWLANYRVDSTGDDGVILGYAAATDVQWAEALALITAAAGRTR